MLAWHAIWRTPVLYRPNRRCYVNLYKNILCFSAFFTVVKGDSTAKKLAISPWISKTAKSTCVATRFWQDEPSPNPNMRQAAVLDNFSKQIYRLYQADSESEKSFMAFCALISFNTWRGEAFASWRDSWADRASSGQIALPVCTPWPSARVTLQGREDRATLVIKGSSALFYFVTGHYSVTVLIDQPLPWFPLIS